MFIEKKNKTPGGTVTYIRKQEVNTQGCNTLKTIFVFINLPVYTPGNMVMSSHNHLSE